MRSVGLTYPEGSLPSRTPEPAMTVRRILTTLLAATAVSAGALVAPAPAHAASKVDYGSESVSKAVGRSASCAKAAKALITASQHDYYLKSTAFVRIRSIQTVATNVVATYTLPSGLATFAITDRLRCSGTATRRGLHGTVPIWFSLSYGPDFSGIPLKKLKRLTRAPKSTYSVNYQTAVLPAWMIPA